MHTKVTPSIVNRIAQMSIDKNTVYTAIPVNKINAVVFQPPGRTSVKALETLREEIIKNGIRSPLHILHNPKEGHINTLVDGHRRLALAIEFGLKEVYCMIHENGDAEELWKTVNAGHGRMTAGMWLFSYVHSDRKVKPPSNTFFLIKEAERIFGGMQGLKFLIEKGVSPKIVTTINIIHKVIRSYDDLDGMQCPTKAQIGHWMIKHRMQTPAYEMIKACERPGSHRSEKFAAKRIVKAIINDCPIK